MFPNFIIDIQQKYLPQADFRHIKFVLEQNPNPEMIVTQLVRKFSFSYGIRRPVTNPNSGPHIENCKQQNCLSRILSSKFLYFYLFLVRLKILKMCNLHPIESHYVLFRQKIFLFYPLLMANLCICPFGTITVRWA